MKTNKLWVLIAPVILAFAAFAQNASTAPGRLYNPATEVTVKGTVEKVTYPKRGQAPGMAGMHLFVKSNGEVHQVALGPSKFVSSKGFTFEPGDTVEVTGSKVTVSGKEYVIAREVTKNGKTLTLRDKNGIPEWAGQGGGKKS
jgi:DNA/RNA endonuclease YhcR with UshA esterase domain